MKARPITGKLSIVEEFTGVACRAGILGTALSVPGHLYITNRSLLWSRADRPLHDVSRQAVSAIKILLLRYFADSESPLPARLELPYEDIIGARVSQSQRQRKKGKATLFVHTTERDTRLVSSTEQIERIHTIVENRLGQRAEEVNASFDELIFYLDRSMLDQLFAATPFGTVVESVTEISRKARKGIASEVGAGFVLRLGASFEEEVGQKKIVKERPSDFHRLASVVLNLAQQGGLEHLFSLDLALEPKPYVFFDKESSKFQWGAVKDDGKVDDERIGYTMVSSLYGVIDVYMTLDRESIVHSPTLSVLLDVDSPEIQGIAKVAQFSREARRMELLPLSLAA